MKSILTSTIFVLFITFSSYAQWSTSGTNVYKTNTSGNVGIGTINPSQKLEIYGNNSQALINSQGASFGWDASYLNFKAGSSTNGSVYLTAVGGIGGISNLKPGLVLNSDKNISLTTTDAIRFYTWNSGFLSERFTILTDGKVGINNPTPTFQIDVNGTLNASALYVNGSPVSFGTGPGTPWVANGSTINYGNGNVGIGVASPTSKLHVNGTISATGLLVNGLPLSGSQWTTSGGVIYYGGNVGIGTTAPNSFKLAVEGKIGAREVQVTVASPWPDYVFKPNHKLLSLLEVEQFIKENKHLPEIPSARQIEESGHQLGEMNLLLLKKVEELTLYMIAMSKDLEQLKAENKELKSQLKK